MAAKEHHSRRGGLHIGKYFNLAGKVIGATIMAYPTIQAVSSGMADGNLAEIPEKLLYYNTGYQANGQINFGQTGAAVASFAGGYAVMKIFSFIGKHLR